MRSFLQYFLLVAALVIVHIPSYALSVPGGSDFLQKLETARNLYYSGSYAAAEQAFEALSASAGEHGGLRSSEIEAYRVLCSVAMGRVNAGWAMEVFSSEFPTAPELPMVRYSLASRYFDEGRYGDARKLFGKIRKRELYRYRRNEFEFKRSFCNMRSGAYAEAAAGFENIISSGRSVYHYPSLFYLGYVRYLLKDFRRADSVFRMAAADSRFAVLSSYYSLECAYMQKDYAAVAKSGPAVYEAVDGELKPKVARILSESFYFVKDRKNAARYLDIFRRSGTNFSRKELYFSGVLAYDMKNYSEALISLRQITAVPDSLSQNAWYVMAGCHLGRHNRIAALNAFRMASEPDFDASVKERALFNYAKLSFDLNSDISRFEDYMKAYPDSGREDEINGYAAASFIRQKDYASAVASLVKIKKRNREASDNLGKAAYLAAMQKIGDDSYGAALQMLDLSKTGGRKDALGCLADYWRGECLYRSGKTAEALSVFESLAQESAFRNAGERKMLPYNIAYCHFDAGDYEAAASAFSEYLASEENTDYRRDAKLRLGDALGKSGNHVAAAELFEEIHTSSPDENDLYPALRGAEYWALAGKTDKQIKLLSSAVENNRSSELYPRALYDLGCAEAAAGLTQDAMERFLTLQGMGHDNEFYAKSLVSLGRIYASSGKADKAISCYRRVVEDCRGSMEVAEALSSLESAYASAGRPDEYVAYLDRMGMSDLKGEEGRERMLREAVEKLYGDGNYAAVITAVQTYLADYPSGEGLADVEFCMAGALASTNRRESAVRWYAKSSSDGNPALAAKALRSAADLSFEGGNYAEAVKFYSSLLLVPDGERVRIPALSGRMRSAFALKKYDNVITDAGSIQSSPEADASSLRLASYYLAKSYLRKDERDYARPILKSLAEDAGDDIGAEANYLLIEDAFNRGEFEEVRKAAGRFMNTPGINEKWLSLTGELLKEAEK